MVVGVLQVRLRFGSLEKATLGEHTPNQKAETELETAKSVFMF